MFIRLPVFSLVSLALFIFVAPIAAQSSGDSSPTQLPGVNYNGQRFGYTPGYTTANNQVAAANKPQGYTRPQRSAQPNQQQFVSTQNGPAATPAPAGQAAGQLAAPTPTPQTVVNGDGSIESIPSPNYGPSYGYGGSGPGGCGPSCGPGGCGPGGCGWPLFPFFNGCCGMGGGCGPANACTDGCFDGCNSCCTPLPLLYGRAEYLLFWTRGMHTPVLATTSTAGTAQANAGVLGFPTTADVFGGSSINSDHRSGAKFTLGSWFDPSQTMGIEASYMFLGNGTDSFAGSNNGFNILARPFFNASTGVEDARLIAFPGVVSGNLNIGTFSSFQTFDIVLRQAIVQECCFSLDGVLGYRYGRLNERVNINDSTLALPGTVAAGTQIASTDQFGATNSFHGGEMGLIANWQNNPCWSWEGVAKVALGQTNALVNINGQTTTTTAAGVATTNAGGLLTQATNIGTYNQHSFGTLSEFGLTARRHFSCRLSATFGYSFFLWSQVARAGEQIDRQVNPTQIPPGTLNGAARPEFLGKQTDFWAQGLRFGLEYQF